MFLFARKKPDNIVSYLFYDMERLTGIGPASSPWEGEVLPLNNSRNNLMHITVHQDTNMDLLLLID